MPGQLNFSLQLGGGFSMFEALLQLFPKNGTTGEYLLESILSDMTGQRAKKREHNWTLQFNFEVGFNPAGSVWVPSPKLWHGSPLAIEYQPYYDPGTAAIGYVLVYVAYAFHIVQTSA